MNKSEIIHQLHEHHQAFLTQLRQLSDTELVLKVEDKWTPIQHLDHICRSTHPLNLAFSLPSFVLQWKFGKSNRPTRTYVELVEKYQTKLAQGGKATKQFVPEVLEASQKDKLLKQLEKIVHRLEKQVNQYNETLLDRLVLPHPLLGKLTLREMLYFTIYHVQHHQKAIQMILEEGLTR